MFTGMEESTAEDWATIAMHFVAHGRGLADRILAHVRLLDGDFDGFAVDRRHSLQTATRAFRGYCFFHHLGMDRNLREEFRGHPGFERTALFCERYDSPAFDPAGETLPLEHFEPMVRPLFEAPHQTLYTGMISPGNEPAHS